MSNKTLSYKGYHTVIEYSVEDAVLHGKIEGIRDLVTFESDSAKEIEKEFHSAVDDYLAFCKDIGQEPDKEYSGTFNVRIKPNLHRDLAMYAIKNEKSLNAAAEEAISDFLDMQALFDHYVSAHEEFIPEGEPTVAKNVVPIKPNMSWKTNYPIENGGKVLSL